MKAVSKYMRERSLERGAGMMEMVFTIPVLLFVAGATIDISRYMTFLQVTSFISQEAGSQVYRHCSDLTSYEQPDRLREVAGQPRPNCPNDSTAGHPLCVNVGETKFMVAECMVRIQTALQRVLNSSIGSRGAISSNVFRVNIREPSTSAGCATGKGITVEPISAKGDVTPSFSENVTTAEQDDTYSPSQNMLYSMNQSCVRMGETTTGSTLRSAPVAGTTQTSVETNRVQYVAGQGIKLDFPSDSGRTDISLMNESEMCNRKRIVVVEVAYAFEPVVKFLPNMMVKLDTNAINREVSVF